MIRNYLSSPEGQKAIGEFVTTPKGKRGNETGSARAPQVFVSAPGSPVGSLPETRKKFPGKNLICRNNRLSHRANIFPEHRLVGKQELVQNGEKPDFE